MKIGRQHRTFFRHNLLLTTSTYVAKCNTSLQNQESLAENPFISPTPVVVRKSFTFRVVVDVRGRLAKYSIG
jgi:hypothetical protein